MRLAAPVLLVTTRLALSDVGRAPELHVAMGTPTDAQFAFPLAAMPVGSNPAAHCEGVLARAVAVAALPL